MKAGWFTTAHIVLWWLAGWVTASGPAIWENGHPQARLCHPRLSGPMKSIVDVTVNGYLADAFGWSLPSATDIDEPGLYILAGNPNNNIGILQLVLEDLKLDLSNIGDEGFRIITAEKDRRRFVIVGANTPIGLKHGCQELVYFHLDATATGATVDWPMDIRKKPDVSYRGVYMLPCWAAYDSLASWKRVLEFHSELTLNRNWFWLAGFDLLEQYAAEYNNCDLASAWNVTGLVDLCRSRGMKFYIGGGWFTWHHEKIAGGSIQRGVQYYRDMVELFPHAEGIYLEPAGEGRDIGEQVWHERTDALALLADLIRRERPAFEFAIAIGKFNSEPYLQAMHEIDDHRLYWWWCWGDPVREKAMQQHPRVLRWHTIVRMSDFHGSNDAPRPDERELTGFVTSYDPGQGFGNPWNGWGKLGIDHPREFHPHTMPFFSHQYLFRERCWNLSITNEAFADRLKRRLFDADMPAECIGRYLDLADLCSRPIDAAPSAITEIETFVQQRMGQGTPRNQDTLNRMAEALAGLKKTRDAAEKK